MTDKYQSLINFVKNVPQNEYKYLYSQLQKYILHAILTRTVTKEVMKIVNLIQDIITIQNSDIILQIQQNSDICKEKHYIKDENETNFEQQNHKISELKSNNLIMNEKVSDIKNNRENINEQFKLLVDDLMNNKEYKNDYNNGLDDLTYQKDNNKSQLSKEDPLTLFKENEVQYQNENKSNLSTTELDVSQKDLIKSRENQVQDNVSGSTKIRSKLTKQFMDSINIFENKSTYLIYYMKYNSKAFKMNTNTTSITELNVGYKVIIWGYRTQSSGAKKRYRKLSKIFSDSKDMLPKSKFNAIKFAYNQCVKNRLVSISPLDWSEYTEKINKKINEYFNCSIDKKTKILEQESNKNNNETVFQRQAKEILKMKINGYNQFNIAKKLSFECDKFKIKQLSWFTSQIVRKYFQKVYHNKSEQYSLSILDKLKQTYEYILSNPNFLILSNNNDLRKLRNKTKDVIKIKSENSEVKTSSYKIVIGFGTNQHQNKSRNNQKPSQITNSLAIGNFTKRNQQ